MRTRARGTPSWPGQTAPRPDTLTQTGQITSHKPLADGAGHTFLKCRAPYADDRSRRRREISDPESGAECGAGAGIGRSVDPAFRPSLRLRQLRSIDGEMPSSLAICSNGRSLLASRATASRLNSSVY